jgi:hypothetical protein
MVPERSFALPLLRSLAIVAVFASCSASADAPAPPAPDGLIQCEDPRPEICTRDYTPVCALRDTGIRCVTTPCESTEWVTASNACSACSDARVSGYRPGACPEAG